MRRALALLVVLLITYMVRSAGEGDARSTALALGFALIAAALSGSLFAQLRLPRVTGYLLFGMICGPYVLNLISRPMARELQLFNGLAVALIAFVAGLEMNLQRLRPRLRTLLRFGGVTLLFMYASLLAAFWLLWSWLPIAPEMTGLARFALVLILVTIVVSFSPTVTIAVITESRARGPLSEMVLALVILGDLILILLFTLAMQFVRWTVGGGVTDDVHLMARLAWEIPGSFAFGAMVGAGFAIYLRFVGRELTVMLLGLCVLLSVIGGRLHFETLLAALAAGMVVENVAPPRGDALKEAVERGALPILIIFFVAAGASMHLDALATIGLLAVAISAMRMAGLKIGTALGARTADIEPPLAQTVWTGLVSQAGVTLGLTIIVASEFPTWGLQLQTLMVALIALHELIGPVLFRAALARAGEVGQKDVEEPELLLEESALRYSPKPG
jgi:Kef-type K+ transport system membrane component KefB